MLRKLAYLKSYNPLLKLIIKVKADSIVNNPLNHLFRKLFCFHRPCKNRRIQH